MQVTLRWVTIVFELWIVKVFFPDIFYFDDYVGHKGLVKGEKLRVKSEFKELRVVNELCEF